MLFRSTLWEGEFAVTWGTPFDALKDTFLSKVKAEMCIRDSNYTTGKYSYSGYTIGMIANSTQPNLREEVEMLLYVPSSA